MRYLILMLFSILVVSSACNKEDQDEIDQGLIESYIKDNQLNATSTESGLYYIITKEGSGANPSLGSFVEVEYTGKLLNGEVFDSGTVENASLASYIRGWQEGIPFFKKGGEGTLIIPSRLGYGDQSVGSIPANSVLVFDIKLIDF